MLIINTLQVLNAFETLAKTGRKERKKTVHCTALKTEFFHLISFDFSLKCFNAPSLDLSFDSFDRLALFFISIP